jgi:type IV pilus assembly protein PilA
MMEHGVLGSEVVLARLDRRPGRRGFTLVELMIVVAIVGVLATVAVVGYRRYVLNAKVTEARTVISAIRLAQEDTRAERGTYANIGTTYCPAAAGVSNLKVGWDTSCNGGSATWQTLPVHIDGPVQFAYATVAGTTTMAGNPLGTSWVAWNSPTATPWYVISAKCDLDGVASDSTELVGSSFQNTIFSRNEGL